MNVLNLTGTARDPDRFINPRDHGPFGAPTVACLAEAARRDRSVVDRHLGEDAHLGVLVAPHLAAALRTELRGQRIDVFDREPGTEEMAATNGRRLAQRRRPADPAADHVRQLKAMAAAPGRRRRQRQRMTP